MNTNHRAAYLTICLLLYNIYAALHVLLLHLGAFENTPLFWRIFALAVPFIIILMWYIPDWLDDPSSRQRDVSPESPVSPTGKSTLPSEND